jgi:hypothetical protein
MSRLFSFLATTSPQPRQSRLLRKLLDGAQAIAARELEGFRFRLADALLKLSETTHVPAEEQASFHGHNHLRKEGDKLCAAFMSALNQHTSAGLRALEEGRQDLPPLIPANLDGAEERLLLDELASALEKQCADALAELNCSLGALLEREALSTHQNPWRPQVFLTAFHHAWCTIDDERATRRVVLGMLGPQLFLRLDALYAGLNAALAEAGISPDAKALARARRSAVQVATSATDKPDAPALFAATTSPTMRVEDERYYRVRDWLLAGSPPAGAGNEGDVADLNLPDLFSAPNTTGDLQANTVNVAVAPRLFAHLTRLQQKLERTLRQSSADGADVLRHISRGLPPGVLSRVDENTLELVERVFEQLLQSPAMSTSLKPLLVRLQVPVLKAALMDRKFFIDGANPAHRLLDLVVNCGLDLDSDSNIDSNSDSNPGDRQRPATSESLGPALQRAVDRIAGEFDQDLTMCAEVAADLENLLQSEAQQVETAIAECITQGLRAEKLYLAEQAARADLLERLDAGAVPYALENFLQTQWLRVLTLAHAGRNKKPEILERALAVMDDLLWSLQAKADSAERKRLLQRLPDILSRLNTWLDAIKWTGPERAAFFAALSQQHANLVRSPREDSRGKLEAALTQTRRAAERSMFGARRKPLPGAVHPARPLDSLCHGDWLELQEEGGGQRALRLAWVSPQRSQFVLASRHAVSTCLYSERELEHRLQQGQVRRLQVEGAVGRALDAVLAAGRPTHAA